MGWKAGETVMYFGSDNISGASPRLLEAVVAASHGVQGSYGNDSYCQRAAQKIRDVFEHPDAAVFFVATGTAANTLALAALTPPYGAILCHKEAHINTDECGAPEFITGGAKLIPLEGEGGKVTPDILSRTLAGLPKNRPHNAVPRVVSLSQSTELGRVYTAPELKAVADVAKAAGLAVHLDGARFANALAGRAVTPAEMTWKAGVDVLCLSATKNGALGSEAVIFFNPRQGEAFPYLSKHSGHLVSKQRWMGAQMLAWLDEDHWLDLASAANARATELGTELASLPDVRVLWMPEANEVFALLPPALHDRMLDAGATCAPWACHCRPDGLAGDPRRCVRFVTSFSTTTDDIRALMRVARG